LPGEKRKPKQNPDDILIAFAPYPTSKPNEVLPRYFARLPTVDQTDSEYLLSKYFEGMTVKLQSS
jgi:hypothetical protein